MTANKQPRSRISWTSFRAPNPGEFEDLHDFKGAPTDGARPEAAPAPDVTSIMVFLLTGLAGVKNYGAGCTQQIKPPDKEKAGLFFLTPTFTTLPAV